MSQFYDQASLVMVPSGYKDGKLYSQKPLSTSGELSFSRASNATRVGPDGLIEKVRTNLILQSNQFDNAYWNKTAVTIATGQADPNGGTDAFKIVEDTTTNFHRMTGAYTMVSGNAYATSVTAKAAGRNFLTMSNNVASGTAIFNLSDGSIALQESAVISAKATDLGGGWYRCEMVAVGDKNGSYNVFLGADDDGTTGTYLGDGTSGVFIFQSQLQVSDFGATPYIPTTTAAVSVGPVSGLPRLDYSGGASCPSLLLEPQRTNLNTYSEDISQSGQYLATRVTISKNSVVSPDGYQNADKIVQDPSNTSWGGVAQGISPAGLVTLSVFAKKIDNDYIAILGHNSIPTAAWFNIATGTAGTTEAGVTSSKIEAYGNGWFRCSITTSVCNRFSVFHTTTDGGTTAPVNSETALWGFQQEDGASHETSYIPTLSSAVTRVADDCTQADVSGLLGAATGTAFIDFVIDGPDALGNIPITIGATTANLVYFFVRTNTGILLEFYTGSTLQAQINVASPFIVYGTRYKAAFAWANNDFVLYINGLNKGTDTSGNAPTPTKLWLGQYTGGNYKGATINQTLLFPTRLSNADLATLTAL